MVIVLLAAPSAGKGTQAAKLIEKYGYVHISSGDLLRERRKTDDEVGKIIAEKQDLGELVSEDIVNKIMFEELNKHQKESGIILDGYPRNIIQVGDLEEMLKSFNKKIDFVFYLNVTREEVMKRALGRLGCLDCKTGYNKFNLEMAPKIEGICDKCGGKLVSRSDDTEETVNQRYALFLKNTLPLIDCYKKKNLLYEVNANISAETTFNQIENIINSTRE